jgi:NAD(P)H-dependent FMN reductase
MTIRLLALSGSLRAASSNSALLGAAALLAPPGVEVRACDDIGVLPHFNPDLDVEPPPPEVARWRAAVRDADAVLISTPEYAHGLPGAFKNALDWIVSSGEFMNKPVGVLNASARSTYAQASLAETLSVMMALLIPEAMVTVPLSGRPSDAAGVVADATAARVIAGAVDALARAAVASNAG